MRTRVSAGLTAILIATIGSASAEDAVPAWQEPEFVMEEVVVTAPARPETPAPGFLAWIRYQHVLARQLLQDASRTDVGSTPAE